MKTPLASKILKNLLPCDGEVYKIENFIDEANAYFEQIYKNTQWEQKDITLFGKTFKQPRLISWYSDPGIVYKYSNTSFKSKAWPKNLEFLKNKLNESFGTQFNSVLLNLYRTGQDSMGLHSDDEKELGKNPVVASISLGAERVFRFKHKTKKNCSQNILLKSGTLLMMQGETQHQWKHELPKAKHATTPRLNLTFRTIKD